jgi:hypothetical protein
MSIKIDDIEEVMRKHKLDVSVIKQVVTELEQIEEENKAEKGTGPKQKNQFVVVVKGDESMRGKELAAWVAQIPDGEDHNDVLPRLKRAAKTTVDCQKRKKKPINTVGDAFRYSKAVFLKEQKLKIKTKEYVPALVVVEDSLDKVS